MANGSFGLSGFPTAPTTTSGASGGGANNPASSVTASVLSTAGFDAGELIYQRNNDFGTVPGNAVTTSTFPATGLVPVMGGATADQAKSSGATNLGVYGNNPSGLSSARLSNGNIVFVFEGATTSTAPGWQTTQNRVHFKIVTENGVTVVNTTCIDTTNGPNFYMTVTALSTGGFVVAYMNQSTQRIRYGIYSNTGTVTTALQDDSTGPIPPGGTWIALGSRSDGNWVMTLVNASYQLQTKVYSNTGAQVHAWTAQYAAISAGNVKVVQIVRSDNTVVVFSKSGAGSTLGQYTVLSATNTVTVSSTTFTAIAGNAVPDIGYDAALLPSGTIVWGAYDPSGNVYYRTLTSANVFLGATPILSQLVNPSGAALSFFGTTAGGLLVVSTSFATGLSATYAVYDSSFFLVFGPRNLPYFNYANSTSVVNTPCIIDTGTNIGVFFFPAQNTSIGNFGTLSRFDKTTFVPVNYTESTITSGVTSALPVSGYSRSGSTPSTAAFLAATTTTVTSTSSQTTGSFVVGPTQISSSTTVYELNSMSFADGRFGFVTRNTSGVVTAYIYTVDGVLITSFTVTTVAQTNTTNWWSKMVELGDGKIAITYPVSGDVLTIAIYSTSYTLLNTGTFTPGAANNNYNVAIAAISGNRLLVVYCNSSALSCFRVFSNTATQLTAETLITGSGTQGWNRCAALGAGFIIGFQVAGSNQQYRSYVEFSANAWQNAGSGSAGSSGMWHNPTFTSHPAYAFDAVATNSTGSSIGFVSAVSGPSVAVSGIAATGVSNQNLTTVASCVTALGSQVVIARNNTTTVSLYAKITPQITSAGSLISLPIAVPNTTQANLGLAANKGNRVVFSYVSNTDSTPYFVILDALATNITTSIVSGVTPSSTIALSPATGYTLLGVSTAAAPANGTGTVQINGPAALNSQYSATTSETFDFQNPVTFGVAGVISGRNVNLQGNV